MRISASALLRASLLALLPMTAMAQVPVVVEAETGTLGSALSTGSLDGNTYITGANDTVPPSAANAVPGRIASYNVIFPAAGNYDLYVRIRIGAEGANDDSFYISSVGFNNQNWGALYNTPTGGYANPNAPVFVEGTPGAGNPSGQTVWKWVRLTNHPGRGGGTGPNAWVVPAGSLTQTFYWASRENGLFFDKFAFGPAGTCYSVAQLDAGAAGTVTCPPLPPPPPAAYTFPGPAIATGKPKFLGSAWSPGNASVNFLNYFNKVSPENAGKWGSAEPTRDVFNWNDLDTAYALAKNNGLPFHFHVLVWGNQQPNWIDDIQDPAEQLEEIREWYAAVAARYPGIDILEVVNEPLHDPPCTRENGGGGYCDALGGRGTAEERLKDPNREWLWIVNAFKLAREYFPNAKLMLNDYSIENETPQTTRYIGIINLLKEQGLLDIIGVQGHAFSQSEAAPMPTYRANLNRLADTGFPIQVTELDVDGTEDAVQLAGMQKIFPIYWEHPSVTGVTLWGYKQNSHWRNAQGAWLVWSLAGSEGAHRPAMDYIIKYVQNVKPDVTMFQDFWIDAGAPNGTVVGTLLATDTEPGSTFSGWEIYTGDGAGSATSLFSVDAATGVLRVADSAAIAADTAGRYMIHVSVTDGYHRSHPQRVTINVAR